MEPQEPRPRAGVIVSVPMSVLLGVLFFMPWLTVSCDPGEFIEMGRIAGGAQLPPMPAQFAQAAEIAEATGLQLARGEATPVGPCKAAAPTAGAEQGVESRGWIYAGLALPAALLTICTLSLTGKIPGSAAGKLLFLLAFAGVGMMYAVSRINYVDDIVGKARSEFARHAPPGMAAGAAIDEEMDQMAEQLGKGIITKPTGILWITMGAYGVVCICGLVTIGSPTPASQKAILERTARSSRRNPMLPSPSSRPSFRERRATGPRGLPQFGPDLFTPPDNTQQDSHGPPGPR